ncbi:hydrogenase iron-sulfur subunit [Desulfobacterales bacterium HSG16]|nr:hydrogenase iron-sulfur subunit [Desulfobacterales bacterium HSG16]
MSLKTKLIIGSGPCAVNIADRLQSLKSDVIVAAQGKLECCSDIARLQEGCESGQSTLTLLENTKVVNCKSCLDNTYIVELEKNGVKTEHTVSDIILAQQAVQEPHFLNYGLKPSDAVLSLSSTALMNIGKGNSAEKFDLSRFTGKTIVFFAGLLEESLPTVLQQILNSCLALESDPGFCGRTYVMTKNLKVAGEGLESLYRKVVQAGTIFIRFQDQMPEIEQDDRRIKIKFIDEITRNRSVINADMLVADVSFKPDPYLKSLAEIFGVETGHQGFLQDDNVHWFSVQTNRKHVWAAGDTRLHTDRRSHVEDAANIALGIESFQIVSDDLDISLENESLPQFYTGGCVSCITCYRLCPHRAILIEGRVRLIPDACEKCGICAAECPRQTIKFSESHFKTISTPGADGKHAEKSPFIVVYCCKRSAKVAREQAVLLKYPIPENIEIIEAPCGGGVSDEMIFSAFNRDADGVIVLTCHEGNCNSSRGPELLKNRTGRIKDILSTIGGPSVDNGYRVAHASLSSNMGFEFSRILNEFEEKLKNIGGRAGQRKNQEAENVPKKEKAAAVPVEEQMPVDDELVDINLLDHEKLTSWAFSQQGCLTCALCSSACPASGIDGFDPRKLVRMVAIGMEAQLVESRWPWICTMCARCDAVCPMEIKISSLVRNIRGTRDRDKVPGVNQKGLDMAIKTGNNLGLPQEDFVFIMEDVAEEVAEEPGFEDFKVEVDKTGANLLMTIHNKLANTHTDDLKHWWKIFHAAKEDWTVPAINWEGTNWGLFTGDDESMKVMTGRIVENMERLEARHLLWPE